jgi:hypothetical protein
MHQILLFMNCDSVPRSVNCIVKRKPVYDYVLKIKMIKGQLASQISHHRPDLEKMSSTNQIDLGCKFSVYISLYNQILPLSSLPINRLVN